MWLLCVDWGCTYRRFALGSHAQKQALQAATQDAQQQANAVLSSLNLKQKEVVSIQVNNASSPPPIFKTVQESALSDRVA